MSFRCGGSDGEKEQEQLCQSGYGWVGLCSQLQVQTAELHTRLLQSLEFMTRQSELLHLRRMGKFWESKVWAGISDATP